MKFLITPRSNNQSLAGFTLIEMLVVLSVFSLVLLIASNIYVIMNHAQRRALNTQRVMDDVRYVMEAMSQEVRLGRIDYSFYESEAIDLHPEAGATDTLVVVNQLGEVLLFRHNGSGVEFCQGMYAVGSPCNPDNGDGWQNVTPEGVEITSLTFSITPSANPFAEVSEVSCATNGDADCVNANLDSYRCDDVSQICQYFSDGENFQPKVTISLRSRATNTDIVEQASVDLQTTVSSRLILGEVVNLNYD